MENGNTLNRSEVIEILRKPSQYSIDRVSTALKLVLEITREAAVIPPQIQNENTSASLH